MSNYGSKSVSVIATASSTVVKTVTIGSGPAGVAITPDGSYAYVVNGSSNTVSVIATASNTVTKTITVGAGSYGVGSPRRLLRLRGQPQLQHAQRDRHRLQHRRRRPSPSAPLRTRRISPPNRAPRRLRVQLRLEIGHVIATASNTVVKTVTIGSGLAGSRCPRRLLRLRVQYESARSA